MVITAEQSRLTEQQSPHARQIHLSRFIRTNRAARVVQFAKYRYTYCQTLWNLANNNVKSVYHIDTVSMGPKKRYITPQRTQNAFGDPHSIHLKLLVTLSRTIWWLYSLLPQSAPWGITPPFMINAIQLLYVELIVCAEITRQVRRRDTFLFWPTVNDSKTVRLF